MIARFHYDEATLDRLLHDGLRDDETDVTKHVETCDVCQAKMDKLSRDGMSWDEVGELLSGVGFQPASVSEDRPEAYPTFLEPSNHPNSLGRFARYEIMEILGRGGMEIVMRRYDTSLVRHSAIKELASELARCRRSQAVFSRSEKCRGGRSSARGSDSNGRRI